MSRFVNYQITKKAMADEKKSSGPKVYFPQNKMEAEAMIRSIEGHLDPEDRDRKGDEIQG